MSTCKIRTEGTRQVTNGCIHPHSTPGIVAATDGQLNAFVCGTSQPVSKTYAEATADLPQRVCGPP